MPFKGTPHIFDQFGNELKVEPKLLLNDRFVHYVENLDESQLRNMPGFIPAFKSTAVSAHHDSEYTEFVTLLPERTIRAFDYELPENTERIIPLVLRNDSPKDEMVTLQAKCPENLSITFPAGQSVLVHSGKNQLFTAVIKANGSFDAGKLSIGGTSSVGKLVPVVQNWRKSAAGCRCYR